MTHPKKLIEVALPLPEINDASAYDKMPGIGPHPKGIHHWWARLPLPTARAILFASVVDDPSAHPEKFPSEHAQNAERERLFGIIRRLMQKRLHEHPEIYDEARLEMLQYCDGKLPPVLDPFGGGGSIPLEANRLGFEAHAGDLNPVAVLLNKCNLEIAPRWLDRRPVNPDSRGLLERPSADRNWPDDEAGLEGAGVAVRPRTRPPTLTEGAAAQIPRPEGSGTWNGTAGLAADVRYYGKVVRQRAQKLIGHLYPKAQLPRQLGGGEADVVAWIWARTVSSPNPAAKRAKVPLVRSFVLSTQKGKKACVQPIIDKAANTIGFVVREEGTIKGTTSRTGATCLLTDSPIPLPHIRAEGKARRLGVRLMAVVAESKRGKLYLTPSEAHEAAAEAAQPENYPETELPEEALGFRIQNYGFTKHWQMFTPRQLQALVTLSDHAITVRTEVVHDAVATGMNKEDAEAYANAVGTFLALAVDRCADFNNSFCGWNPSNQKVMHLFGRQAIPMIWDFAEANIMGNGVGAWSTCSDYVADCLETVRSHEKPAGSARQIDAAADWGTAKDILVSTDPPYYDNIGYAVLSDFFYIWLRRTIGSIFPEILGTVLVPKLAELTASPENFDGDKERAKEHFESGFRKVFTSLRERLSPHFPLSVYYAFKQEDEDAAPADEAENGGNGVDLTTGWETLLEALVSSGFQITGTWPIRASQQWRMRSMGSNALASYIVLGCRSRPKDAVRAGRSAFVAELKRELPPALRHLQQGNVAPVDFAQAAIGPGMAVFSRYSAVLESSGKAMSVRTALALINGIKDELLGEAVEELDKDTRWAVTWFSGTGFDWGEAGQANLLANAQATAVNGLVTAGIIEVKGNQVRLFRPEELPADWDPATDKRLTVWEMTHHLVRVYVHEKKGDEATAEMLKKLGTKADVARDLAYKLFTVCENKKWSKEAQAYNALVMGWPELTRLARQVAVARTTEQTLPGME